MESSDVAANVAETLTVAPRPVGSLIGRRTVDTPPGSTLRDVVTKLVDNDVGVIVVADGDDIRGILSERGVRHLVVEGPDGGVVSIRAILRSILS